jgi:hypothetical protein
MPGSSNQMALCPSASSMDLNICPGEPPMAAKGVLWPPRLAMARETLIPPPPTANCGSMQRSLVCGTSLSVTVARSMAGLSVTVRMVKAGPFFCRSYWSG